MTRKVKETALNTDKPLAHRHVNMSNALARAAHGLNLAEKRIIACGLACTDSSSSRSYAQAMLYGGWLVKLTATDYAETMKIAPHTAYEQLKEAAASLIKKQWAIADGKKISRFNWLSRMTYHDGEGWVELEFTHHTAPHLLALQKQFTSYQLQQAAALRSIYSWRLLECFESWKDKGKWSPTIEEFCHAMDAKPSHKKNFGMLRRSVIEPAVKELTDKDNLLIDWKTVQSGRKVIGLNFSFRPDLQLRLEV